MVKARQVLRCSFAVLLIAMLCSFVIQCVEGQTEMQSTWELIAWAL